MLNTEQQQKAINALLKRAENSLCADCNAKSPCWASLDFGVFVCMNCSGAHRALGPSVTRVKSTKLDTWNREWLLNMQVGNTVINQYWQSQLTGLNRTQKPNVNTSLNQIIKFVHNKYVKRKYAKSGQQTDPLKRQKTAQTIKTKPQKQKEPVSPLINAVKSTKQQSDLLNFNANTVVPQKETNSPVSNLINFQGETNKPKQKNLLSFQGLPTNATKKPNHNIYSQPTVNNLPSISVQQNNGAITFDHLINNYNNKPQSHNNHFFNGNQPNYYPQNHYQNHYSMQHAFHGVTHNSHSVSHNRSTVSQTNSLQQGNVPKGYSINGKITLEADFDWNGEKKQKQAISTSWTDQWK